MRVLFLVLVLLLPAAGFADLVVLKGGAQISGTVESATAHDIRIRTSGRVQVLSLDTVDWIRFDQPAPAPPAPKASAGPSLLRHEPPVAAAAKSLELPAGTELVIRTIDRIESKKADLKHLYQASLDEPLAVNGITAAPANSLVMLQVTGVTNAKVKGRSALTLQAVELIVDGKKIPVSTEDVSSESGSQGKRTAIGTAAGAGVGAGIGGAAAGGAGAAGGAAAGAAAGAVGAVLFGQRVKIEPETRFTFVLSREVSL